MKLTIEETNCDEIEVIVKGKINNPKVQTLISFINTISVSSKVILWDDEKEILTNLSEIYYFTTHNRHICAKTMNQQLICKYTLNELSKIFENYGITQISKSTLVNVHHIKSLEAEFSGNYLITLSNGEKIMASRFYMKNLRKAIMEV